MDSLGGRVRWGGAPAGVCARWGGSVSCPLPSGTATGTILSLGLAMVRTCFPRNVHPGYTQQAMVPRRNSSPSHPWSRKEGSFADASRNTNPRFPRNYTTQYAHGAKVAHPRDSDTPTTGGFNWPGGAAYYYTHCMRQASAPLQVVGRSEEFDHMQAKLIIQRTQT